MSTKISPQEERAFQVISSLEIQSLAVQLTIHRVVSNSWPIDDAMREAIQALRRLDAALVEHSNAESARAKAFRQSS